MSVYDELLQFQILPDAFYDWQEYRADITGYIIDRTKAGSSLAILGAGRCNDIDLAMLAEHFAEVTLFDANLAALEEALILYGQEDNPHFHLVQYEFSGITGEDYRFFSEYLSDYINTHRFEPCPVFAKHATHALQNIYQKADEYTPDFGEKCFDYAMIFGVHSQINNMAAWIWNAFLAHLGEQDATVEAVIIHENTKLVQKLNDAILRATRTTVFFGNELNKIQPNNTARSGSIQGACQCIDDLRNRFNVTEQALVYWPFTIKQNIIYQMLIQQVDAN